MYPFTPRKVSEVNDGDFYSIPLSNKKYACARLLMIEKKNGRKTKTILVGLHDWFGRKLPAKEDIHQTQIIEQGVIHINSIGHIGGQIIGNKPLEEDDLKPLIQFEAGYLIDGFNNIKKISYEEGEQYSRRSTYGLNVIKLLAEKHFVKNSNS